MMLHAATEEGEARLSAVGTTPVFREKGVQGRYGTPRVVGSEGLSEVRVSRPQSEKPLPEKIFPSFIWRASRVVIGASTEHRHRFSQSPIDGPKGARQRASPFLSFRGQRRLWFDEVQIFTPRKPQ